MLLVHPLLILLTFAILFLVYFLISRDLSGRKRAVESLQKSKERFRQVAAMTGEWIWEQDLSGRYIYSNSVGYTPEEVLTCLSWTADLSCQVAMQTSATPNT